MFFLIDDKNKIIFGWSAKCGCSHIKSIFWFLQNNNINNKIHTIKEDNSLPNDIENYTTIVISRNPYKRIISGFLDKYNKQNGQLRKFWKYDTITFSMFIDELLNKTWKMVDYHHFTPQTSQKFNMKLLKSKYIKFYDIENIDYDYIENLYNKKIPEIVLNKKYGHERKIYDNNFNKYVYDIDMDEYYFFNVDMKYFYNEEIKNKVYNFYKNDFIFFLNNGINYTETTF
jgi:hypothetical protein